MHPERFARIKQEETRTWNNRKKHQFSTHGFPDICAWPAIALTFNSCQVSQVWNLYIKRTWLNPSPACSGTQRPYRFLAPKMPLKLDMVPNRFESNKRQSAWKFNLIVEIKTNSIEQLSGTILLMAQSKQVNVYSSLSSDADDQQTGKTTKRNRH